MDSGEESLEPDATGNGHSGQAVEPSATLTATGERRHPGAVAHRLPRWFAIANQKGGVGKTTTAVNLGAALAELDYRVLVVDLDPQGNATTGLGINARNLDASIYDVILHDVPIEDVIEPTTLRNLFVVPATIDLAGAEIELVPVFSRELRLRRALETVEADFDFILIDCPPSLGLLTVNGLAAAGEVVVPIQCEYYALEGLGQLLRNVGLVQTNLNQRAGGQHHHPDHVRRPHPASRAGRRGGPTAFRRPGLPQRGAPHRTAFRGALLRPADHRLRLLLPGRDRLPGAGQGGERWRAAAG